MVVPMTNITEGHHLAHTTYLPYDIAMGSAIILHVCINNSIFELMLCAVVFLRCCPLPYRIIFLLSCADVYCIVMSCVALCIACVVDSCAVRLRVFGCLLLFPRTLGFCCTLCYVALCHTISCNTACTVPYLSVHAFSRLPLYAYAVYMYVCIYIYIY